MFQDSAKLHRLHIPPAGRKSPLLKDLEIGHKRYLYSIMSTYDTSSQHIRLHEKYAANLEHQSMLGYLTAKETRQYMSCLRLGNKTHNGNLVNRRHNGNLVQSPYLNKQAQRGNKQVRNKTSTVSALSSSTLRTSGKKEYQ
ncbi:protein FAM216B [Protopterus annectens]|uniref:protein FAM216B n=1 Tax=Protopterus annectens TaxID=7888 RepID=UPI001CFA3BC3|nr:protein FAM216B [Protopterus annectens]